MRLNEWAVPTARIRSLFAITARSSSTVDGLCRRAARNVMLPAQFRPAVSGAVTLFSLAAFPSRPPVARSGLADGLAPV
jgi:hypothetical protein